jgi:hypothetical protein
VHHGDVNLPSVLSPAEPGTRVVASTCRRAGHGYPRRTELSFLVCSHCALATLKEAANITVARDVPAL